MFLQDNFDFLTGFNVFVTICAKYTLMNGVLISGYVLVDEVGTLKRQLFVFRIFAR